MKNRTHEATAHKPEDILNELRSMVAEAEKMIGNSVDEHSEEAMSTLRERLAAAQERFSELYTGARKKVVAGAKYADTTIRENPYQSLAVAVGVGLLIGVLVGRRTSN